MTGILDAPSVAIGTATPTLVASLASLDAPIVYVRNAPFPGALVTLPLRSAERALTLAGPRDVVCLPIEPDPLFVALLAELGLGPDRSRIVVPRGEPTALIGPRFLADREAVERIAALLPATGTVWLAPGGLSHPDDARLAAAIAAARGAPVRILGGDPGLVARIDHKPVVREAAIALGIPVAEGTVVTLSLDADGRPIDLAPLHQAIRAVAGEGRAIVRGAHGSSGDAVFTAGPEGLTGDTLHAFESSRPQSVYLVEQLLTIRTSPNVQMFIDPAGAAVCVGVADQLLTAGLAHHGNAYPSEARTAAAMVAASMRMAEWLSQQGYRGVFGLDFVEYEDDYARPRWILAEINPRFNGSTQPAAMLERLNRLRGAAGQTPIAAFAGGVLPTRARTVRELLQRLGSRRYDRASGSGVVPFHTAGLSDGVYGLTVFAPSRADAIKAFKELEAEETAAANGG